MDSSELCGWIGSAFMLFGTWLIAKKKSEGFLINFLAEGLWIARGTMSGLPDIVFVSLAFSVVNFWGWCSWKREEYLAAVGTGLACVRCGRRTVRIDKGDIYVYRCHKCRLEGPYHKKSEAVCT